MLTAIITLQCRDIEKRKKQIVLHFQKVCRSPQIKFFFVQSVLSHGPHRKHFTEFSTTNFSIENSDTMNKIVCKRSRDGNAKKTDKKVQLKNRNAEVEMLRVDVVFCIRVDGMLPCSLSFFLSFVRIFLFLFLLLRHG